MIVIALCFIILVAWIVSCCKYSYYFLVGNQEKEVAVIKEESDEEEEGTMETDVDNTLHGGVSISMYISVTSVWHGGMLIEFDCRLYLQ